MSDNAELIARLHRANEYEPLGHDAWEAADALEAAEARIALLEGSDKWAALRTYSEDAKHHARLSYEFACEAEAAEARAVEAERRMKAMQKALEFYACKCGDQCEVGSPDDVSCGYVARAALAAAPSPAQHADGCRARQYSDSMVCDCGLCWDTNDPYPPTCPAMAALAAAPSPAEPSGISSELVADATDMVARLRSGEDGLEYAAADMIERLAASPAQEPSK